MEPRNWIEIAIGVCTIGAATLTSFWVGSLNAAKFTGAAEEKFKSFSDDVKRLEQVDRDQWKALSATNDDIGAVRDRVSKVEGRMNGKAHSAGM